MKRPGPIKAGSKDHEAILAYAHHLSSRFEMALPAALGLLVKFDGRIGEAGEQPMGMSSLIIEVKKEIVGVKNE